MESSQSTKYRKISKVIELNSPNRLIASGMHLLNKQDNAPKRLKLSMRDDPSVSEDEAISLISDMQISKRQYTHLLQLMEQKNLSGLFPSQRKILARENQLLPPEKIISSKYKAEIDIEFFFSPHYTQY